MIHITQCHYKIARRVYKNFQIVPPRTPIAAAIEEVLPKLLFLVSDNTMSTLPKLMNEGFYSLEKKISRTLFLELFSQHKFVRTANKMSKAHRNDFESQQFAQRRSI